VLRVIFNHKIVSNYLSILIKETLHKKNLNPFVFKSNTPNTIAINDLNILSNKNAQRKFTKDVISIVYENHRR